MVEKLQYTVSLLPAIEKVVRQAETERNRARMEKRMMEGERDRARIEKRDSEGARDRVMFEKQGLEGERDRARTELQQTQKRVIEIQRRLNERPFHINLCQAFLSIIGKIYSTKNYARIRLSDGFAFTDAHGGGMHIVGERVFSLLNNSFHKFQESSMEDCIESSLMLQYNKRD